MPDEDKQMDGQGRPPGYRRHAREWRGHSNPGRSAVLDRALSALLPLSILIIVAAVVFGIVMSGTVSGPYSGGASNGWNWDVTTSGGGSWDSGSDSGGWSSGSDSGSWDSGSDSGSWDSGGDSSGSDSDSW